MKLTRLLSMLLVAVMLVPMVVACNESEEPSVTTTVSAEGQPTDPIVTTTSEPIQPENPTTDANGYEIDDLDPTLNLNNAKINILAWKQSTREYDAENTSGDDVDSALYDRNRKVEDRLGIELNFIEIPGSAAYLNDFVQTVNTSISNNTGAYDAVAQYARCAGILSTYGVYKNLYDVEHLNFDKPWWPSKIVETNTIGGNMYFVSGDIATSLIYMMEFMIVNNDYAEARGIDVAKLQEDALNGKWTLSRLLELSENAYSDEDEKKGKSDGDKFGLYINEHQLIDMFYVGAGLRYIISNEEGVFLSDDFGSNVSYDLLRTFAAALKGNDCYQTHSTTIDMTAGTSLFYTVLGSVLAVELRNAAYAYSILPAPKYNEAQDSYYTAIQFPHSMYTIPVDVDADRSGAVLECMASESHRQVTPVLFEKCFKYKYATTSVDTEMLTVIRDSTVFDLGRAFYDILGASDNPVIVFRGLIEGKSVKIAGQINKHKASWNQKLEEVYTKLSEIE